MAGRLAGKVAIVTGAGSGIGAATVEAYHREGAKVVAADISGAQEEVAKRLGEGCVAVHTDVAKTDDIKNMLATAVDTFGRLDILHNNAGIDGVVANTGEYSEEDFDHVWSINGRAVFLGMRYAIPIMLEQGGGTIVNTASMASMNAFPGMPAYCAAKGAVLMLTKTAAAEYAAKGHHRQPARGAHGRRHRAHPDGPHRRPVGSRQPGGLPGQRRILVHDRIGRPHRRRLHHALSGGES
jgi:NAD(P)-dependent dehydrogenase (short-subunit alcohol dehydrogenase family)